MQLLFWLLIGNSQAERIIQSQWMDSYSCEGPPDAMYVFNIQNLKSQSPKNETWAPLYTAFANEFIIGKCGYKYTPIFSGCCFASLDLNLSSGWKSGSPTLLKPDDFTYESSVYVGANDHSYCSINPINGSLFNGLSEVLFLADDKDICVDKYYKCNKDGSFLVYPSEGCTGTPATLGLQQNIIQFDIQALGNFEGRLVTYQNGATRTIWTLYTPSFKDKFFVPNPNAHFKSEILRLSLLLLTLLFYTAGIIDGLLALRKGYKFFIVIQIVSQLLYMALATSYIYQLVVNTNSSFERQLIEYVGNWLYGLATLFNIYINVFLLYSLQIKLVPQWTMYPVCAILFMLHILLNGAVYINVCNFSAWKNWSYCTSTFRSVWRLYIPYWIITMFIWNLVPATLLIIFIVSQNLPKFTIVGVIKSIWFHDKFIFIILLIQLMNIVSYQNVFLLTDFNDYLDNDKAVSGVQKIKGLLRSIHSLFNIIYLHRIRRVFKSVSKVASMNKSDLKSNFGTASTAKSQ
ncbi:hypothetical protein HDV02_003906 [Globomyces sp. JEL0801]|nr:hypothetical protein HDV02_003906 [Globomyces sp. JEL0801]